MINSLNELNDKITQFANYIVRTSCENTFSGSYNIEIEDACAECNIELDDFINYRNFFEDELNSREELLEININSSDIDISCALNYCPNYEWENGDEEIFGSFEEFITRSVLPYMIAKAPLSLAKEQYYKDTYFTEDVFLAEPNRNDLDSMIHSAEKHKSNNFDGHGRVDGHIDRIE